jgi:hypothetical protein
VTALKTAVDATFSLNAIGRNRVGFSSAPKTTTAASQLGIPGTARPTAIRSIPIMM